MKRKMKNKVKRICMAVCCVALLGFSGVMINNVYNTNAESDLLFPQEYVIEKEYDFHPFGIYGSNEILF